MVVDGVSHTIHQVNIGFINATKGGDNSEQQVIVGYCERDEYKS